MESDNFCVAVRKGTHNGKMHRLPQRVIHLSHLCGNPVVFYHDWGLGKARPGQDPATIKNKGMWESAKLERGKSEMVGEVKSPSVVTFHFIFRKPHTH